jgi:hypothetical protein
MPAPKKQSPNSPATDHPPPAASISPATAARVRQLAAQAHHRHAVAEFRTRRAADQQSRLNALLLETISALASLFSEPSHPGNHSA